MALLARSLPSPCSPRWQASLEHFRAFAGAAINSLAGALTALALNLSPNPNAVYEILFWLMGSLVDRSLDHVALAAPLMALGWILLLSGGRALDALTLGEETASSLGFTLGHIRLRLILGTALSVGAVHWPLRVEKLVALGRLPHRDPMRPLSGADLDAVGRAMAATDVAQFADRTIATLSGGERLRVLLARAMAVEAPFLLVDEPIAELDPAHQLLVMGFLRRSAQQGVGVVAVLHDLTLAARFSDRVMLLHNGTIVAEGRPANVLSDANLRAAYGITALRGHHDGEPYVIPWEHDRPKMPTCRQPESFP